MNRLLRLKEVEQMVGLSRTSIYRLMDRGDFPHPVRVGPPCRALELERHRAVDVGTPLHNRQS